MKCISCGNLIPDASVVCPYCNSKVQPEAPATPVYDVKPSEPVMTPPPVASSEQNSMTSAIPETPSQPVLPQDQGMSFASLVSSNTGATNNSVSTGTVQSSDGMMSSGTPVQGRPAETNSTVSVGQVSTPLQPSENSLNNVGAINNSQPVNPAPVGKYCKSKFWGIIKQLEWFRHNRQLMLILMRRKSCESRTGCIW